MAHQNTPQPVLSKVLWALGGLRISAGRLKDLHWYGLAGLLLALIVSHWATYI